MTDNFKGLEVKEILRKKEEQLIHHERKACILCKQSFETIDKLIRHQILSDIHAIRLKRLKREILTEEQLIILDRIERIEQRATKKDGGPCISTFSMDESPMSPMVEPDSSVTMKKGAAILSKMGWREGEGLGKHGEGMVDTLKMKSQKSKSGLGSKTYTVESGLSYSEAAKKVLYKRIQDLADEEEEDDDDDDD